MVKETQIEVRYIKVEEAYAFYAWETLGDTVRLTGRCRKIKKDIEREIEITHCGPSGRWSEKKWIPESDFRTVEYFDCDEAPE